MQLIQLMADPNKWTYDRSLRQYTFKTARSAPWVEFQELANELQAAALEKSEALDDKTEPKPEPEPVTTEDERPVPPSEPPEPLGAEVASGVEASSDTTPETPEGTKAKAEIEAPVEIDEVGNIVSSAEAEVGTPDPNAEERAEAANEDPGIPNTVAEANAEAAAKPQPDGSKVVTEGPAEGQPAETE